MEGEEVEAPKCILFNLEGLHIDLCRSNCR